MGKTNNSGLGVGVGSSPQGNLNQSNIDIKVSELAKNDMIDKLVSAGVKFNPDDVIFVTNDKSGQMVWLEKGNEKAGLEHITKHANEFLQKHGVKLEDLPNHIMNIVTQGKILHSKLRKLDNGNIGYEKIYLYNNKYYALAAIGTNGFIVSIYPLDGGK